MSVNIQYEEAGAALKPLTLNDRSGNSRIFDESQPHSQAELAEMQARSSLLKRISCLKHQTSEENPLILQQQQLQQQQAQLNQSKLPNSTNQQPIMSLNRNNFTNQYQNSEQIPNEMYYNQNNNQIMRMPYMNINHRMQYNNELENVPYQMNPMNMNMIPQYGYNNQNQQLQQYHNGRPVNNLLNNYLVHEGIDRRYSQVILQELYEATNLNNEQLNSAADELITTIPKNSVSSNPKPNV